jgi:hypothetical protein
MEQQIERMFEADLFVVTPTSPIPRGSNSLSARGSLLLGRYRVANVAFCRSKEPANWALSKRASPAKRAWTKDAAANRLPGGFLSGSAQKSSSDVQQIVSASLNPVSERPTMQGLSSVDET